MNIHTTTLCDKKLVLCEYMISPRKAWEKVKKQQATRQEGDGKNTAENQQDVLESDVQEDITPDSSTEKQPTDSQESVTTPDPSESVAEDQGDTADESFTSDAEVVAFYAHADSDDRDVRLIEQLTDSSMLA